MNLSWGGLKEGHILEVRSQSVLLQKQMEKVFSGNVLVWVFTQWQALRNEPKSF